jgi:hypothetical protein
LHTTREPEVDAVAAALRAAADDVRISTVHGAAFVSGYLLEQAKLRPIPEVIVAAAEEVAQELGDDPLAMVQRQRIFGAARGKRDVERSR